MGGVALDKAVIGRERADPVRLETSLILAGRHPRRYGGAVNPPVVRASTIISQTLDEWDALGTPGHDGMVYGRIGTTTTRSFEEAMAELEGGGGCFVFPSGLAANIWGIMPFVTAGDHVLVPDNIYGPVRRFCENRLRPLNVEVTYYDPTIGANIR
jgi:cystathionine beta-lyase